MSHKRHCRGFPVALVPATEVQTLNEVVLCHNCTR